MFLRTNCKTENDINKQKILNVKFLNYITKQGEEIWDES